MIQDLAAAIKQARPDAKWRLKGNTLDGLTWLDETEPPTLAELEAAATELNQRKVWENSHDFLMEFTTAEQNALANNPNTAGLALQLATWKGEVWSDDERIAAGLNALVFLGIISEERKAEIIS